MGHNLNKLLVKGHKVTQALLRVLSVRVIQAKLVELLQVLNNQVIQREVLQEASPADVQDLAVLAEEIYLRVLMVLLNLQDQVGLGLSNLTIRVAAQLHSLQALRASLVEVLLVRDHKIIQASLAELLQVFRNQVIQDKVVELLQVLNNQVIQVKLPELLQEVNLADVQDLAVHAEEMYLLVLMDLANLQDRADQDLSKLAIRVADQLYSIQALRVSPVEVFLIKHHKGTRVKLVELIQALNNQVIRVQLVELLQEANLVDVQDLVAHV